jgi:hypothetical protein
MEKRGKEIILLVLALLLVVITVVTLLPKKGKAPQAAAAVNTDQGKATASQEEIIRETGKKSNLPAPGELLGGSPGSSPNRNPFASPALAGVPTQPTPASVAPKPLTSGGSANVAPTGSGTLPPFFPQGSNPAMGAAPGEPLQFTGLMGGEDPMAIVRRGETRYFVHVGDAVDNYRVTSIGSGRVTLKSKEGNKIILHLGGGA